MLNGSVIASYGYARDHNYPFDLQPNPPLPTGVMIVVTNAEETPNIANSININTSMTVSEVSILNDSTLHCEDSTDVESGAINIRVSSLGESYHTLLMTGVQYKGSVHHLGT